MNVPTCLFHVREFARRWKTPALYAEVGE